MSDLPLKSTPAGGIKKDGDEGAGNTARPLDITNLNGGPKMPADGTIPARGDSASKDENSTWKSIGDLAAEAVEKRYACYATESIQAIAERKAGEVISALDNDDFTGARMATESLCRFFAEYASARVMAEKAGGDA